MVASYNPVLLLVSACIAHLLINIVALLVGLTTTAEQRATLTRKEMTESYNIEIQHLGDLRSSGLNDETIRTAGLYSASTDQVRKILGFNAGAGLAFPYPAIDGLPQYIRIKPDVPPVHNGHSAKYLSARGSTNRLYVPAIIAADDLLDVSIPLLITEGEKKALRAAQDGFLCIALSGVWNFRTRTEKGQRRVLSEFKQIEWEGRIVYIVFDSDAEENENVRKAEKALAQTLERFNADVRIVRLPPGENGEKVDLDDFLIAQSPDAMEKLMDAAAPPGELAKKETSDSQAARLVKMAEVETELFHDQYGAPYARIRAGDHYELWPTKSTAFKEFLGHQFYKAEGKAASTATLTDALNVVNARARFDGPEVELHNRAAQLEGELWYDLTDQEWRAVRITLDGWEIVAEPPLLFRRYAHHAAQVGPIQNGDLDSLFEFISIRDEDAKLLLKVWMISCLIPDIPHPVPVLHGPQGSGKSSTFKYLRRLIDPSELETLTFPRNYNELVQKLSHNWVALFDNVDILHPWQSDALCRAVTGEGFAKRQLFTDDEDILYRFRRCIGLNGINVAATRADLLDRALLIGLERISPDHRRTERELEHAFNQARPALLGAMFNALAKAMQIEPEIQLVKLPRMADFARWGCAIAVALGHSQDDFLTAYNSNQELQNTEALEAHPLAAAVVALIEENNAITAQPQDLLNELTQVAEQMHMDTKDRLWPKSPNALSRRLREVKTNLANAGIDMEMGKTTGRGSQSRKVISLTNMKTAEEIDNIDNIDRQAFKSLKNKDGASVALGTDKDASVDVQPQTDTMAIMMMGSKSSKNNGGVETVDVVDKIPSVKPDNLRKIVL